MMVKSVVLPLAPDAAFDLFTANIGLWWPEGRRHSGDPASDIFLLEGGRFFERARDGREVELGRVCEWDRPRRIRLDFFIATGPDRPTTVEIAFAAHDHGARVTVTHGPSPASAALWAERAPRYGDSWDAALASLAKAACLS